MRGARLTVGRNEIPPLVVISLALTNLSVAQIGDFRLMVFWPILLVALGTCAKFKDGAQVPSTAILFLLAVALMLFSTLVNLPGLKTTSLALTLGWTVYWYFLVTLGRQRLAHDMDQTLSRVAKIYFLSLLLSALMVMLGWQESPLPNFLGWIYDQNQGQVRYYGPTSEPSYAALILGITGLGILRWRHVHRLPARCRRSDLVFMGILISLLFLRSIYGYVVALVLLSAFAAQTTRRSGAGVLLTLALVPFLPFFAELLPQDSRFRMIFTQLSHLSFVGFREVDSSAYMRFGPSIEMLSRVSLGQPEFWIGHGAGSAQLFFGNIYRDLVAHDLSTMDFGFFPSFLFDYGALACLVILLYLFTISQGAFSTQARFIIFIALFNCNFNTALFWYLITVVILTSPKAVTVERDGSRLTPGIDDGIRPAHIASSITNPKHTTLLRYKQKS